MIFGVRCLAALIVCAAVASLTQAAEIEPAELQVKSLAEYETAIAPLLVKHCGECHGDKLAEKKLNLSQLEPDMKATTSAARWAVVLQQLREEKMPPKDEPRLAAQDLETITGWIEAEMKRSGKHVARREAYVNGNAVEHALLFDPKNIGKFDTPTSVRRLSPEIYAGFTGELGKGISGIAQPFSLVGKTTFKDMGAPKLDEPTSAALIRNALLIVEQRLTNHKLEDGVPKSVGQGTPKQFLRLLDGANPASDAEVEAAIKHMFDLALRRQPSSEEVDRFAALYVKNVKVAGRVTGARYMLAAVLLLPEAVFRFEQGAERVDEHGRVRLAPREIAFALAYALTDRRPESWLLALADKHELDTDEGVAAAVNRMLADPKVDKPRIARFFREYFQYAQAEEVFKDTKLHAEHDARALVEDTDRLVQYILQQDQDVLYQLLTTNKSFVAYKTAAETKKKRTEELAIFEEQKQKDPKKFETKKPPKVGRSIYEAYNLSDFPDEQPVELPASERAGILTQPSWLVAFSKSDENDAIHRGKWVRERLLGGVVPDIPITVDAQLPIAPDKTLRERMAVTRQEYCWQCHKLMNRTGYPFENYDHLGRYRTKERVLDLVATAANVDKKGKPLGDVFQGVPADASGGVDFIGDERCEGDVKDAVELMHRLARSERVEQVFIRHAFRYWLGRNETPGDAASLQAAYKTYKESGGSMQALITALLTSESFLYRVPQSSAETK
jgi:mono/diheme cytochrome c family protein